MNLTFTSREHAGGSIVVHVGGELDLATAPQLQQQITALTNRQPHILLLDLTRLGFCDAAGIGVLVSAQAEIRARGGTLALVNPQRHLRRLLAITELDKNFPVYADRNRENRDAPQRQSAGRRRAAPQQTPSPAAKARARTSLDKLGRTFLTPLRCTRAHC